MPRSDPAPRDPLLGARIDNRYTVHGMLGRGGMGVVYDGIHDELGRHVAIKVLNAAWASDPISVERFLREARTAGSLSHGNIVDVSDLGRLPDGRPYLVMPKVRGTDLAALLRKHGPQPPKRVAELLSGAAAALDLIHAKGLVHRDIKPENLMYVVREDGSETVMLLDFGIAALVASNEPRLTRQGTIFGTPEYLPPEVWDGKLPDGRGDVYALATVAFELMTGELPFTAENVMQILPLKLKHDAPRMAYVTGRNFPNSVEHVIARGLARGPDARPRTAGEFVSALRDATSSAPISWRPGDMRASAAEVGEELGALEEPLVALTDSSALALERVSRAGHDDDAKTFLEVPKPSSEPPPTRAEVARHDDARAAPAVPALTPSGNENASAAESPSDALPTGELEPIHANARFTAATGTSMPLPVARSRRVLPYAAAAAIGLLALIAWAHWREVPVPAVVREHEVKPATPPAAAPAAPAAANEPLPHALETPPAVPETAAAEKNAAAKPETPAIARKPKPAREPVPVEPKPAPPAAPVVATPAPAPQPLVQPSMQPAPIAKPALAVAPPRVSRDPALAAQLTRDGTAALLSGQVAHATELLRRATAADASHAPAYRSLGLAYERAGKNADAIASYEKYLKLDATGTQADKVRERLAALRK